MKRSHIFILCFLLLASFGYCTEYRYTEAAKRATDEMSQPEKNYTITESELSELDKMSGIDGGYLAKKIRQREQEKIEKERDDKIRKEWEELNYIFENMPYSGCMERYWLTTKEHELIKKILKSIESRDKSNEENLRQYQRIK